ncbi:MAG TPA: M14 metallopeptidase family protein [Bacteroidales bacterium]|nr:M14 metallopeptidase family protein [Bacteroidales bacterium]
MRATSLLKTSLLTLVICMLSIPSTPGQSSGSIINPKDHFGFTPGDDGMLFDYGGLTGYLKVLDDASPKLKMVEIGSSPMGKPMYIAFVSSADNISRLGELKEINRELALNPDIPDAVRKSLIDNGKVFVLGTHSLHSSEVAPAQAVPIIAHKLITSDDPLVRKILDEVVFMIVPNPNPDGMDMIVNNYKKYKGTRYEGAILPGVYHKYVGHDNNRDFVILSQEDTKVTNRIYSRDWFPQVYVDKHQMGSSGIRYFVPPLHDPIAEVVDAELWNWTGIFSANMLKDMTSEGLAGVGTHTIFDLYWPGASLTAIWKNVIGMLTEAAGVKTATPIYVEPNELSVGGKGLSEYKKGVNLPLPWEGGWWKLEDIVEYEIASTMSVLKTAYLHKDAILQFRNDLCRKEVENGKTKPPCYYVLPEDQRDQSEFVDLVNLMKEHGINIFRLKEEFNLSGINLHKGDIVIPLAQPFRPFIKEVMEAQQYPVRHYTPGGEVIKPYDITSWSLPLHRQVRALEITGRSQEFEFVLEKVEGEYDLSGNTAGDYWAALFPAEANGSFKAAFSASIQGLKVERIAQDNSYNGKTITAGSFLVYGMGSTYDKINSITKELKFSPYYIDNKTDIKTTSFEIPRIALIEPFFRNTDAGWTRFVLDSYNIPFTVIRPGEFENTDFVKDYDVVIFPSCSKALLMTGKMSPDGSYLTGSAHPDFIKGIGDEGMKKLMAFLDNGGTILAWGESTELFVGKLEISRGDSKEEFHLPFILSEEIYRSGLYVPGSLLQVEVLQGHPLTFGMPEKAGIYFSNTQVFSTSIPGFDMDRRVIAKFPEKDILLSGYAENEELLGNKSAIIWLKKGKGQLVLFGFNPQFRASTQGSYKLLFNAILLPEAEAER